MSDITGAGDSFGGRSEKVSATSREPYYGRDEMDSHADTTVTGNNYTVLIWYPQRKDLASYPHIEIMSIHHWNTHQIRFPQKKWCAGGSEMSKRFDNLNVIFR